jgi:hypothetical protein
VDFSQEIPEDDLTDLIKQKRKSFDTNFNRSEFQLYLLQNLARISKNHLKRHFSDSGSKPKRISTQDVAEFSSYMKDSLDHLHERGVIAEAYAPLSQLIKANKRKQHLYSAARYEEVTAE